MGTVTVVSFDIVFIAERWLRHRGTLATNTSGFQKILSICATIAALVGAIGLICLTCLNDWHHHKAHDACLAIFMYVSFHRLTKSHSNKYLEKWRIYRLRNLHLLGVPAPRDPLPPAPSPPNLLLDQTHLHLC